MKTVFLLLLISTAVFAQKVYLGAIGGGSLTRSSGTSVFFPPGGQEGFQDGPADRSWMAGAALEVYFLRSLSLEVDALLRHSRTESFSLRPGGARTRLAGFDTNSVQFPVLLKHRFATGSTLQPFVAGGMSFRTSSQNGSQSQYGVTAGVGADVLVAGFKLSPTVRYTRWNADRTFAPFKQDQVELLVGLGRALPQNGLQPFGRRLSFGLLLGTTLSDDVRSTVELAAFDSQTLAIARTSGPRSLLPGVSVELEIGKGFSVEADAIYRQFRIRSLAQGRWFDGRNSFRVGDVAEFPVLAKYRFDTSGRLRPFLEAGPSFRTADWIGGGRLGRAGVTGGAGIEMRLGGLRIAPRLRFTHWGADTVGSGTALRNQVQGLVGFSF